ncbi:hypothetical protein BaRGS_00010298 [Batillaria attramentaria]|uniref:Uncharacterized protein n=1 Tax=Batillaria attramentaria TaxID=370345 RepID=A0ABD0LFH9_9CAEN
MTLQRPRHLCLLFFAFVYFARPDQAGPVSTSSAHNAAAFPTRRCRSQIRRHSSAYQHTKCRSNPSLEDGTLGMSSKRRRFRSSDVIQTKSPTLPYCYRNLCKCNATYADCSQNNGRLDFVPELPRGIVFLNFSFNDIKVIANCDFFHNVSHITGLDLTDNDLSYINDSAFRDFRRLQILYIGRNDRLTFENMTSVLIPTLKQLHISYGNLSEIPGDIFSKNPAPRLETLNLQANFLNILDLSALKPLKRLKYLRVDNNDINTFIPARLQSLISLDLSSNFIREFPRSCSPGNFSYFPKLEILALTDNCITSLPSKSRACIPRLGFLDLSNNLISVVPYGMFRKSRFPELQKLLLSSSNLTRIRDFAFVNSTLTVLAIDGNAINFTDEKAVERGAFADVYFLHELYLDNNTFSSISDERFQKLFNGLTSLRLLSLSFTGFSAITRHTFEGLLGMQELRLNGNFLREVPTGAFSSNENLTTLQLQSNLISTITQHTFKVKTRSRLLELDLYDNPFICSCNLVWFQHWFLFDQKLFASNSDLYRCKNLNNTDIGSFYPGNCEDVSIYIYIFCAFILLFVVFIAVVFICCVCREGRGQGGRNMAAVETGYGSTDTTRYEQHASLSQQHEPHTQDTVEESQQVNEDAWITPPGGLPHMVVANPSPEPEAASDQTKVRGQHLPVENESEEDQ